MENRFFVTSDGVRLHYTRTGSGSPVIFLPGLGQTAESIQKNAEAIGKEHSVYVLDYRNHGESENTLRGNHIEQYAKDLKEMLDDADIREFFLIAHSMGNAVAWCFMELYGTARIQRYVLEEEAPALLSDPSWTEKEQLTYRGLREWPSFIPVKYPEDIRESAIALLWHDHINRDWRDAFDRLTMPVLIIMGTESHYASEDLWQWLKDNCINSEFLALKGGHAVHIDNDESFNKAVLDFFSDEETQTEGGLSGTNWEMKNKYAVDKSYDASGKTVAIIGAAGNWGAHLAIGMALTSGCDLILADCSENKEKMEQLLLDLEKSNIKGSITTIYLSSEEMYETDTLYQKILSRTESPLSVMDVRSINK